MGEELSRKMNLATKWSSITEICSKLIAPLTNMILARLLTPEVFGLVATLTVVVSFAEIFTDAGFQKYLVQHQFADEEDLNISTNVAFWTNLVFSLLVWGVIVVFATPIAELVGSSGHEDAIIIMGIEIPLLAFSSIQMARYRREFDFKNLFVARMMVAAVPLVVTVPLALVFKSHWALVAGTLTRDVLNAVILTIRSKWKPAFTYSINKLREMLSFSMWTMVENVVLWLTTNVGIFIVGAFLSSYYLGLFKTTISTANGYMGIITAATTPVLFSALSRCQDSEQEFRSVFFKFQRMVALLVFPLGFGAFVFRELATQILLGSQWMETADFLGLWFLTSSITIVFSNYNSEAYRSKGRPKLSILVQVLHLLVLIPVLLWGVHQDYRVLTWSRALVRLQIIIVSALVMRSYVGIRFVESLRNVWPSLCAAMIMALAGTGLLMISNSFIWQIVAVGFCVVVYAVSLLLMPAGRQQMMEIPILKKLFRIKQ